MGGAIPIILCIVYVILMGVGYSLSRELRG